VAILGSPNGGNLLYSKSKVYLEAGIDFKKIVQIALPCFVSTIQTPVLE
jgi:hypothetical protein